MVTRIHPQCALSRLSSFQDHLVSETLPPFRIILHWTTLMYSSSGLWESGKPAGFSYRLAWLYATTTRPRVV